MSIATYSGLIDADDTIFAIIDLQPGFLAKVSPTCATQLVDNVRFLTEVAIRRGIPLIVTVEEPSVHGPTDDRVRAVLPANVMDRDKRFFGLGGQDDLIEAVHGMDRRTVTLVGFETDVCVLQSAVGLRQAGYRAVVVRDAVGAPGPEHEYGLERARSLGIELIHTKGLYYEWARSLDGIAKIGRDGRVLPPFGTRL